MTTNIHQTDSQDFDTVVAIIRDYFDGLHTADTAKLEKIFHSDCVLKLPNRRRSLAEWLHDVRNRRVPNEEGVLYRFRILAVDIVNDQAMVKVECPLFENFYIDFLGLLKEQGQWRIVNKMYTCL